MATLAAYAYSAVYARLAYWGEPAAPERQGHPVRIARVWPWSTGVEPASVTGCGRRSDEGPRAARPYLEEGRRRVDIGDITRNFHGGNPESVAAHASIVPAKATLRRRVIAFVRGRGEHGATSDEIELALGLSHQTVSARITEAKAGGDLVPSGRRRVTRSGRSAAVLVAADGAAATAA